MQTTAAHACSSPTLIRDFALVTCIEFRTPVTRRDSRLERNAAKKWRTKAKNSTIRATLLKNDKFKGVVRHQHSNTLPGKEREINKNQFYQVLADSISARLLPESQRTLCTAVAVIDPGTWPVDMSKEQWLK
jgi:hypothetical protein